MFCCPDLAADSKQGLQLDKCGMRRSDGALARDPSTDLLSAETAGRTLVLKVNVEESRKWHRREGEDAALMVFLIERRLAGDQGHLCGEGVGARLLTRC